MQPASTGKQLGRASVRVHLVFSITMMGFDSVEMLFLSRLLKNETG